MLKYYLQFSSSPAVLQRDAMLLPLEVDTMQDAEQAAFDLAIVVLAEPAGRSIFGTRQYTKFDDDHNQEFVFFVVTR